VSPSLDVSANFLYINKIEVGRAIRVDDSVGGMVNVAITPELELFMLMIT
jgi:hypothetical protein